jgi:lipopolysaccharide transport system permease protein
MMELYARKLRRNMDLLWLLTKKEVTLKYKRTVLGVFWSLLNPILLALVFFIAFNLFMRFGMENYTFFLLSALFQWNWFSAAVTASTVTLIANVYLIKKTRFPRHFLIAATTLAQLVNFLFALPVMLCVVLLYGGTPGSIWLVGIPILIVLQLVLVAGISLLTSMLNAYFGDMEHLIGVAITMLFWMSPIVYPLDMVPEEYGVYLLLNPLTHLITAWRELFMLNSMDWGNVGLFAVSSLAVFFIGIFTFQRLGRRLDEVI